MSPILRQRKFQTILVILFIVVGLVAIIFAGFPAYFGYLCSHDKIYNRPQAVDATPLLAVEIPDDANVSQWEVNLDASIDLDWDWETKNVPLGRNGANVFLKRYNSTESAESDFTQICDNGWLYNPWNLYNKKRITYGGEENNQYCASPAINWRTDPSSLCSLSDDHWSYVIFQKRNVLIAIYENERNNGSNVGTHTNNAIQDLADNILAENQ